MVRNYIAAVGGDYFGMENDDFNRVTGNVSTVVDLLDTKGISWGEYQEDMPYAGYEGFNFTNLQNTSHNDYVRKHNPLIIFDSVASNATRRSLIKNFTSFGSDLAAKTLPQWSFSKEPISLSCPSSSLVSAPGSLSALFSSTKHHTNRFSDS